MFGLIGAWAATRPAARAALALAAAAAWAAFGPGDAAAHLAGLATGAALAPLTRRWPLIGRVGAPLVAVVWITALALAARHGAAAGTAGETRAARVGAAEIAVPRDYSAGVPVAPCAEAVTDGLLSICAIDAPDAAAAEAALRAAGHVPERGAGGGGDFFLTARPPGVGVVIVRRAPGGPTVFVHALSAPALAHRAAVVDAIVKLSPPASSPPRR
ncbi:MAG: hypothetical protein H6703_04630 [Myxococcales bacterium]|nr:hypothetical protein [Myxococcales bacterium]